MLTLELQLGDGLRATCDGDPVPVSFANGPTLPAAVEGAFGVVEVKKGHCEAKLCP